MFLAPAFVLALLEVWGNGLFSGAILPFGVWVWPVMLGFMLLKSLVTGFAYGFLADLVLAPSLRYNRASFQTNTRCFFPVALTLAFLPALTHFICYALLDLRIPFYVVQALLQPVVVLIWLYVVARAKRPSVPFNAFMPLTYWGIFFIWTGGYYFLAGACFLLPDAVFSLKAGMTFVLQYLQFATFFFLMHGWLKVKGLDHAAPRSSSRIILVNPLPGGILFAIVMIMRRSQPFVFSILKGLTPAGYDFLEFHYWPWHRDYSKEKGLVAITCFSNNCMEAYRIARKFRRNGSKVVMGGVHVSAFPQEALEFCDAVVVGPVEGVWGKVVKDYEEGALQGVYAAPVTEEGRQAVYRFLLTQPPSTIAACLEAMRGCKFNCYFCGAGHAKTGLYRRSLDELMTLIVASLDRRRRVVFIDDNIFADPAYAKELFRRLIPLKVKWNASSTIDIARDPEALELCRQSGCVQLLIGYEIFPGSTEGHRGAKLAMAEQYVELTRRIKAAGIGIRGHFMYGFETDDFLTFWKLWRFAFRLFLDISVLYLLTPTPDSRFYRDVEQEERFINLNWGKIDLQTLTYHHPRLNNAVFRSGFALINTLFMLTTSMIGASILGLAGLLTWWVFSVRAVGA